MTVYDSEYINAILEKLETLINKQDFKNMYSVTHKDIIGWNLQIDANLEQYKQNVMFGISLCRGDEYVMHWWHEFPYPYKEWNQKANLVFIGGDNISALKCDDFIIYGGKKAKESRNPLYISNSKKVKELRNRLYMLKDVQPTLSSSIELNEALMELSKKHHKEQNGWYGPELLNILIEHTK